MRTNYEFMTAAAHLPEVPDLIAAVASAAEVERASAVARRTTQEAADAALHAHVDALNALLAARSALIEAVEARP